jgi:DNA repair protein RecN (Recombination protein N)
MLRELRIRNFAIIDEVSLPLVPGFNVLSGETGAGKSIIVGALGLLLGERGSVDMIRQGAERATVEGMFDSTELPELSADLEERGIDVEDGLVVLRRELVAGGKGRAWVNGTPVSAAMLAAVGRGLVNLHGQHESQTLLHPDAQRGALDGFAGAMELARSVREAHAALSTLRDAVTALTARRDAAARRADYLRHVSREIEGAKLIEGEDAALEEESRRLASAEELRHDVARLHDLLEGADVGVLAQLASARRTLAAMQRIDPSLSDRYDSLESVMVGLAELVRELRAYDASLDSDPRRLNEIERRREEIHRLTRKYGGSVTSVLETLRDARAELEVLDTADLDLRALAVQVQGGEESLRRAARELTAQRTAGAKGLAEAVDALLPSLGLDGGRFTAELARRDEIAPAGAEDVEFYVALNVGHEPRPMSRVASGGELSRIMLALKTILARLDRIPTLVFDEVDSGIGGFVALQVGDALRALSASHQVLVITHLAQIAARAHHHIVISKAARAGLTTADITVVDGAERVSELARMLDGDPHSAVSRAHAHQLLESAEVARASSGAVRRVSGAGRRRH